VGPGSGSAARNTENVVQYVTRGVLLTDDGPTVWTDIMAADELSEMA
jgi:hypothetical protein